MTKALLVVWILSLDVHSDWIIQETKTMPSMKLCLEVRKKLERTYSLLNSSPKYRRQKVECYD